MNRSKRILYSLFLLFLIATRASAAEDLRQKLGQMFVVGFNGTTLPESVRVDLASRNLGGVILLGRNCVSPLQMLQLNSAIRSAARTPPFIMVDQEGGTVARLNHTNGFDSTRSAYMLGTVLNAIDSTRRQAERMAGWLRSTGFTTTLAPVVDVNVNPQSPAIGRLGRSFSAQPATVAQHAQAFLEALHAQGIMTAFKHFPGHGSAGTDSHLQLPDITQTWADSELVPYRLLFAAGSTDMVMIGHLYDARRDSLYPTSLSFNTITQLLRDSLRYNGVVISDDFYTMRAITDRYSHAKAAELAIKAGTDILLFVGNTLSGGSLLRKLIDTLETKVRSGVIAENRVNEAYYRIQALKMRYGLTSVPLVSSTIPGLARLHQNYPNPFNPTTTISYELMKSARVTLSVYDVLGREVATLVAGEEQQGWKSVRWDATGLASGVYMYRLHVDGFVVTRKMAVIR